MCSLHTTVNEWKRVAGCNFNSFPKHIKLAQNLMIILEGQSSFFLESEELRLLKLINTFIHWSWVTQQQNTYSIVTQEPEASPCNALHLLYRECGLSHSLFHSAEKHLRIPYCSTVKARIMENKQIVLIVGFQGKIKKFGGGVSLGSAHQYPSTTE